MLTQGDGTLAGREGVIRCIFLSVSKIFLKWLIFCIADFLLGISS